MDRIWAVCVVASIRYCSLFHRPPPSKQRLCLARRVTRKVARRRRNWTNYARQAHPSPTGERVPLAHCQFYSRDKHTHALFVSARPRAHTRRFGLQRKTPASTRFVSAMRLGAANQSGASARGICPRFFVRCLLFRKWIIIGKRCSPHGQCCASNMVKFTRENSTQLFSSDAA